LGFIKIFIIFVVSGTQKLQVVRIASKLDSLM
jgi:hypothetical protein